MDESGDLGFDFDKHKTSRFFIVSFLFVENTRSLEKIIKKVFQGFSKKEIKRHSGALHFHKEHPKTRLKVLHQLAKKNITIMSIYLDKKSVYTRLHDEKHVLYNYVTNILLDRVIRKKLVENGRKIQLIASQRETNKFLNDNFSSYLTKINSENHKIDLKICIESHYKNKVLQLADAISWTLFRKREHGDDSYYQIIKDKVVEENKLFR